MVRSGCLGLFLLSLLLTIIESNADPINGECKDTQTSKKCGKWKDQGKCEKEDFAIQCMKTCDKCDEIGLIQPGIVNDGDPEPGNGSLELGEMSHQCKDSILPKKCKRKKNEGKCENEVVANKCKKTCGLCVVDNGDQCKDTMPARKCKKRKNTGRCQEEGIANKCMRTCGLCDKEPKKGNYFTY